MVIENVGETEEKAREGKSRRVSEEVLGYVQDIMGKKRFWVISEYVKLKEISTGNILITSGQEE